MSNFNPNANATLGLEWHVHRSGLFTLDSKVKAVGMSLVQSTAQNIGAVRIPLGPLPVRGGNYAVEVFDNETAVASNVLVGVAFPNEDVSGVGFPTAWHEDDGTATNIYDQIDEGYPFDLSDYIRLLAGITTPTTYRGRFNTASFVTLTSKRILRVTLGVIGVLGPWAVGELGLNLSGVDYPAFQLAGPTTDPYVWTKDYYLNPSTNAPWTIAEVQAFDSSDEWYIIGQTLNVWTEIRVYAAFLEVTYCDENRIAVGTLDDTASGLTANDWNAATMTTPTGGTWGKDGSGRHLYVVRRLSDTGAITVPYLAAPDVGPNATGWSPTVEATYGYVTAMNDAHERIMGVIVRTTAPADSVDSQPYTRTAPTAVHASNTVDMEFTPGASTNYGFVRFMVNPSGIPDAATLTIKVKRVSNGVQAGGDFDITAAEIRALPSLGDAPRPNLGDSQILTYGGGWRLVEGQLASVAALSSGVQYQFELTADDGSAPSGDAPYDCFFVNILDSNGQGNAAGFGSTTDRAESDNDLDLAITIATVPTAPANFAAAERVVQHDPTAIAGTTTRDVVDLTWSATSLSSDFERYIVRRSDDGGTTYKVIASIVDESIEAWTDEEALRGVETYYDIRVVRADGATSYSATPATATCQAYGCEMLFVSNYSPDLAAMYDRRPSMSFDNADAGVATADPIYGRDKLVGAQPLEALGWSASFVLQVGFDTNTPAGGGAATLAFEPLRAIAKAQIPYVCVLDHYGTRMYAQLRLVGGAHENPGERYTASCVAIEVDEDPFVVEVST